MTQGRIWNTERRVTEDGADNGTKRVPAKTVLIVVRGMSLAKEFRVAITIREVTFNQDLKALIPSEYVDAEFLYYYLLSQNGPIRDSASEAAHGTKKLDMQVIEQWPLLLPPLLIQKKIAAILSTYDDLIENNKRRIALLEKMAEEIYREWFVRMRFPGHEKVKFKKGLPVSWDVKRLGDILELAYGKALKESDRTQGNFPVYGSGGVIGSHNKFLAGGPGIIIGRKGNVGSVHWSDLDFFPIDTVYYVKSNLSKYYLYYLLQSMNFINNDAAVPGLNRSQAYSNQLYFPGRSLIEEFADLVKNMFCQKSSLLKKNEHLKISTNMLLSRLISGKLSVEDIDIHFPPSMQNEQDVDHAQLHLRK